MGGVATVPRSLQNGRNGMDGQLDVLRYRFAACTVGAGMTLPGIYFTYITFTREFVVVPMGPLLLTFGFLLLLMGVTCCVVAIRRGEPPIPNRRSHFVSSRPSTTVHTSTTMHIWHTENGAQTNSAPPVAVSGTMPFEVVRPPPYSEVAHEGAPPPYWGLFPSTTEPYTETPPAGYLQPGNSQPG